MIKQSMEGLQLAILGHPQGMVHQMISSNDPDYTVWLDLGRL